jgi:hypothetical protein
VFDPLHHHRLLAAIIDVSLAGFPILKQNIMQIRLFGTFSRRKNRYDTNTAVEE